MKEKINKFIEICGSNQYYEKITYVLLGFILFYPYNISFKDYIFPNTVILALLMIIMLVGVCIINYNEIKIYYASERHRMILYSIVIFLCFILFRNNNIIYGNFGLPFFSVFSLILFALLCAFQKWHKVAVNIILFYTFEHVIGTIFCFAFPEIYKNYIMPLFLTSQKELTYQFEHGQIAGITMHYSANATYLLIGIFTEIFTFKLNKKDVSKRRLIFNYCAIIVSFFALLLTGKRAQILGGILAFVIVFVLMNRSEIKKIAKKLLIVIPVVLILIILVSIFVPVVITPVTRTINSIIIGDLFKSRQPMYRLASEMFFEKPIVGHGWGSFKYIYHENIEVREKEYMEVHNIYLQLLSEIGIIGFIYFAYWFVKLMIMKIKYLYKKTTNNLVGLSTVLFIYYIFIEGLVGNPIYETLVFMPCLIILAIAMNFIINEEVGKENGKK